MVDVNDSLDGRTYDAVNFGVARSCRQSVPASACVMLYAVIFFLLSE